MNPQATEYEIGQRLFDYLAGTKQVSDAQVAAETAALRGEIPSVDAVKFRSLPQLNEGAKPGFITTRKAKSSTNFQSPRRQNRRFRARPNATGRRWASSRVQWLPASHLPEFLERMARTNAAEDLTPTEFAAVTRMDMSFSDSLCYGRAVSDKNASLCSRSVGLKLITQMGGTAAVGQVDDKLVLSMICTRNVKVAPNGRVEVIDAINRELTSGK